MSGAFAIEDGDARAYPRLVAAYGSVPTLFRAQICLPRVVEAEGHLIEAILGPGDGLQRRRSENLICAVAQIRGSDYCRALHGQTLPVAEDDAALRFAVKLARYGPWFSRNDVEGLRASGFPDSAILQAIAATGLGQMLCTLDAGLRPAQDLGLRPSMSSKLPDIPAPSGPPSSAGPHFESQLGDSPAADFRPYTILREQFGFVPNLFKAQAGGLELLGAEVRALELVLFPEDHLTRVQKEYILLALSAANFNAHFVAVHGQILEALGISREDSDQVVDDHRSTTMSEADKALLDEIRNLAWPPAHSDGRFDSQALRAQGFTEGQIVEAVAMAGLTNFLTTVQFGLGAVPDFPPRRPFSPKFAKDLYPSGSELRPTLDATPPPDPDIELVVRVQGGETDAFEELVRRHTRRIFGTLAGMLGNTDDARDATQDVFLKAFEHIGQFQGRSKFSTWLTSIAIHVGTELLRQRRPSESLQNEEEDEKTFRPRQVQSWAEDPEQLLTAAQTSHLVRQGILQLPQKYRVAVLLRDMNQLSTEEAAAALGLSIPALKARLLRGRLMLRERLAPHFIRTEKVIPDA